MLSLQVLGYEDHGEWAAHCLETDLVGRGRTFREALKHLEELTEMQVSFAVQTNKPALLDHPAPPDIWQTYMRLSQERLRNFPRPVRTSNKAIGALPFPNKIEPKPGLTWRGA